MRHIIKIARVELKVLFCSPIAWFLLMIFIVQTTITYMSILEQFVNTMEYTGAIYDATYSLFVENGGSPSTYMSMLRNLFLYIPLLTMGFISREFSSGSIKLLFSSPIKNYHIILGKFCAVIAYALLLILILFLFSIHASTIIENFDWGLIPVSLLGIFLTACTYGAIGVFMSSLTSYQIVAALSTFIFLSILTYVGQLWQTVGFVREITYWLSINGRAENFTLGLLCTEDIIYFITVTVFFLMLAIMRLSNRRIKRSPLIICSRYAFLFICVILVAYLSSRPILTGYYDATRFERNTLTKESQEIMSKLEEKITITTYVNIFDNSNIIWRTSPAQEIADMKGLMGQYQRFKKDIKMNFVYYYSTKGSEYPKLRKKFKDETDEELVDRVIKMYDISKKKLLTEDQVLELEDLYKENFKTIKIAKTESGKKGYIRYFNDNEIGPSEREVSASFKRMINDIIFPKVAFLSGHGERSIINNGDRNYRNFTSKNIRSSLYNQGFDVTQIDLNKLIPEDVNILVIADIQKEFTNIENANFQEYIERGGNLFILGEPARYDLTNNIIRKFGVTLREGRIVAPIKTKHRADLIITRPTQASSKFSYFFERINRISYIKFGFPSVAALEFQENDEYIITPLVSSMQNRISWVEIETHLFDEVDPTLNTDVGEKEENNIPIMLALERKINNKNQKIIISGDADCVSSQEIKKNAHDGYYTRNGELIFGLFNWLSDNNAPVDTHRPRPIDNSINIKIKDLNFLNILFKWVIPLFVLLLSIIINYRRRIK